MRKASRLAATVAVVGRGGGGEEGGGTRPREDRIIWVGCEGQTLGQCECVYVCIWDIQGAYRVTIGYICYVCNFGPILQLALPKLHENLVGNSVNKCIYPAYKALTHLIEGALASGTPLTTAKVWNRGR